MSNVKISELPAATSVDGNDLLEISEDTGGGTFASKKATAAQLRAGLAASGPNSDITSLSGLTTALSVAQGGTGATTAGAALTALGAVAKAGDTMTGVLAVTAGTVSAPGLAFSGDTNTGIYSPAADTIAFTEGGVEAMRLDSSGQLGLGTQSPAARLDVAGTAIVSANSSDAALRITQTGTGNALVVEDSANPDSTPFAVDTAGRVLSGATASYAGIFGNPGNLQISSTSLHGIQSGRFANDVFGSDVQLVKSRSTTIGAQAVVQNGDSLGNVLFGGSDGTAFLAGAIINAAVDGTPGTNDMPGRLVFSTTADGASSPTERMRITAAGNVGIGTASPSATLNVVANSSSDALRITQTGTGNALVVEDAANPDATPLVVDADGSLITGGTARFTTATTGAARIQTITGSATISRFVNDANPQRLEFVKSRSTTSGSAATVVQSGDTLGQVNWQGADGTAFVIAATIDAAVDGTPGTNDMPGRLVFSTTADGASSPTERMRIDAAGNVGIGTSAPTVRLDVNGSINGTWAGAAISIANGGTGATTAGAALTALGGLPLAGGTLTGALAVTAGTVSAPGIAASGDTNTGIFFPAADTIAFTEGGTEALRITSSGSTNVNGRLNLASDYKEGWVIGSSGTAYTIDLTNGTFQDLTLTGNCTLTFPSVTIAGRSFILLLTQDGTGGRTVTWPAAVRWPGGIAPTITSTANRTDKFIFTQDGLGRWLGSNAGQNYSI